MTSAMDELQARVRQRRSLPPPPVRRAIRLAAGASLPELGRVLGVTGEAVRLWESGLRNPRGANLAAYIRVLSLLQSELSNGGHG